MTLFFSGFLSKKFIWTGQKNLKVFRIILKEEDEHKDMQKFNF